VQTTIVCYVQITLQRMHFALDNSLKKAMMLDEWRTCCPLDWKADWGRQGALWKA